MQLNREALLKFIEWAEDHADRLAPYEESVDLITAIGLRCRLACMQRQESAEVVITSLSPEELKSSKTRVLSNIGPLTVEECEIRQSGPSTFEKGGRFFIPIDEFQLLIEWGEKRKTVTIFGPYIARLADAYLHDDTSPGVPVPELATAVGELLTGKQPEQAPYIGTRRNAEWRSMEAIKILRSYISSFHE
jgi:hypothetical protein